MTIKINPSSANVKVNPASASYKAYRCFQPYGWSHYVDLTIDHTQVTADVSDHTILIQDTAALAGMPADFWTTVQADGGDIVVTDARSGRHLHQELEYINTAGGSEALAIHARMPTLSGSTDDVLRIYYGNAAASMPVEKAAWASHWKFVSHMANNPADATQILDSTVNGNTGTKGAGAAAPTEVAGLVGRAQSFGGDDYMRLAAAIDALVATNGTYSIVACVAPTVGSDGVLYTQAPATTNRVALLVESTGLLGFRQFAGSYNSRMSSVALTNATPTVVSAIAVNGAPSTYVNGTLANGAASGSANTGYDPAKGLTAIGSAIPAAQLFYIGLQDELRLSSSALSADENKLIYLEYLAPATLYGFGSHTAV